MTEDKSTSSINVIRNSKPRIGVVAGGLQAYWQQFPGLEDQVLKTTQEVRSRIKAMGADVIEACFIDVPEKAVLAGETLRAAGCDLVIYFVPTYLTSSMVVPVMQRAACPSLILNLQPGPSMSKEDRADTGRWLAYCGACPVPEIGNAFQRAGIAFRSISGHMKDDNVWKRIESWINAAAGARALQTGRIGLMGHLYPGMLDVSTDPASVTSRFGGHIEILEFDDLRERVNVVTDLEVEQKLAETKLVFDIDATVNEDDLLWAARVAVGLDKLVIDFDLDALAYYHRGLNGELHERLGAGMILGASLLTAKGIPIVGEFELRTALAMLTMSRIGAGGSFTELQALDFDLGHVEMGHDGPAHVAISDGRPALKGLGVFHGKRGWGVSVEFDVAHGPITAFGITQLRDGSFRFVASEGTVVGGPLLEIGNTTSRVDFGMDPGLWVDEWSGTFIAHHWALGTGHRINELKQVADLIGVEFVQI